jgi:hypothetical protein
VVPGRKAVELCVREEVVLKEGAGEFWVREARGDGDEGHEGSGEVGDGGGVGVAVARGGECGWAGRLGWVAVEGGGEGGEDGHVVVRWRREGAFGDAGWCRGAGEGAGGGQLAAVWWG